MLPPRLRTPLLALLLLTACSSSDPSVDATGPGTDPPPDPLPELDVDAILFRVWTFGDGGREKVRWVGTVDGPLDTSPEQTQRPWVGFARAFRVEWKASSDDLPVTGTRYRVSQSGSGPWLPFDGGKSVWGQDESYVFENWTPAAQLGGTPCEEGPDCASVLRFASGRHHIEVGAITSAGRELDPALGRLEFEINYAPHIAVVQDAATGPTDPAASAVVSWERPDGSRDWAAVAEGDTVPSGATLRLRVRGSDRLPGSANPDSMCCDVLLDPDGSAVQYQALTRFFREDIRGVRDSLFTLYEAAVSDSIFSMVVGPFDYEASFRAVDEHGRRGAPTTFRLVAGFPPLEPTCTLADGAGALLHRTREAGPGEIGFERGAHATRSWDPALQRWRESGGALDLSGTWFTIPIGLRGEPDPRVLEVTDRVPANGSPLSYAYSDHVRSFAYLLVHEADPENEVSDGPGDRADRFLDADAIGTLDIEGAEAWQIFVPDLLFDAPHLFEPGSCLDENFCDIGDYLRARLGEFELMVRSRTTRLASTFHQNSPAVARDIILSLTDQGRVSPWMHRTVSVRLALTDATGALTGSWPTGP